MLRAFTLAVLLLIALFWTMTVVAATTHTSAPLGASDDIPSELDLAASIAVTPTGVITVTTTEDEVNSDGDCSLREAIQAADTDAVVDACSAGSDGDTVYLSAGHYLLTSGQITLTGVITLQGSITETSILDANHQDRVLYISPGATVMLLYFDIRNGQAPIIDSCCSDSEIRGGGILNFGMTYIAQSSIHGNRAGDLFDPESGGPGGDGGGIYNGGILTLSNTTVSDNEGGNGSAGVSPEGVPACGHPGEGGGIANFGILTLDNATVANNAPGKTCTIDQQEISGEVGGVYGGSSSSTIRNSIVAGNQVSDCGGGEMTSLGHNLFQNAQDCTIHDDLTDRYWGASLQPLADNGGPTLTHALTQTSLAIDAGVCTDSAGVTVTVDQRGEARPQGGGCDIGAYESPLTATLTIHHSALPSVVFHTPACTTIATPCNLTNYSLHDFAPAWSLDGQKIAFSRNDDSTNAIFVMNADGSEQIRIADRGRWAKWSPDGSKLVFAGDHEGNSQIYVIDADGVNQTRLTHSVGIDNVEPAWSPDGSKILYTSIEPDCCGNVDANIYRMSADGGENRLLATHAGLRSSPWSPDGTKILYADAYPGGHGGFHIMDSNGANLLDIYGDDVAYFAWSPDSKRLAYECRTYVSGYYDICVMNSDGSQKINLTNDDANDAGGGPLWSPDGNKLLFWRVYDPENFMFELTVMNADGSGLIRLIDPPMGVEPGDAVWSPDGRKIAFVSSVSGNSEIYVVGIGE